MSWQQSSMFSSTAQILEAYLQASPLSSAGGSIRWTPKSATMMEAKLAEAKVSNIRTYFDLASAATSPRTPISNASPAASPASSRTAYSNETSSPKKAGSLEIRRRRLPEGMEPRVKNLSLTKSNGATNPQPSAKEAEPSSASSDYNRSPPMESPPHLPPPHIPAKSLARPGIQNSIDRKPVQSSHSKQESYTDLPTSITTLSSTKYQAQFVAMSKPTNLSTKLISLSKATPPAAGIRPKVNHQTNLSMASSSKELPPVPQVEKSLLPQSDILIGMSLSPPPEEREMELPSSQYQPKPSMSVRGLPSGPKGLPMGPKAQNNTVVSRRPVPAEPIREEPPKKVAENIVTRPEPISKDVPLNAAQKAIKRPGPALGSLSSGPKLKPKHQANASISSLTSATVSGPVPLPDFQVHQREESRDIPLPPQAHSRDQSQTNASDEIITIALGAPRPRPSQGSLRSESSTISRSTTPQSHRSASTAATSVSSLPDVPEVRSPLVAPELKQFHFGCPSNHRPLVAFSNQQAPVLCMTCKEDSIEMWSCRECQLKVCTGCKEALIEVRGDLRRMLDESAAGTLVIGKRRVPSPPFPMINEPRNYGGETMSIRSNGSAGARPGLPRGYSSETMSIRSNGSAGARSGPPRVQASNYGPPQQGPYLRQQRSMDTLQPRGPPQGPPRGPPYRQYGPPMPMPPPNRRGPPPQQMRGPPPSNPAMDFIGMPPPPSMMNSRPRPQAPPPNTYPPNMNNYNNYPPPPQQQNFRPRPYPPQQQGGPNRRPGAPRPRPNGPPPQRNYDNNNNNDDDFMPPMIDLSLGAGEGPMAAGMRSYKLRGGVARPIDMQLGLNDGAPGMKGAYPSMAGGPQRPRGMP